VAQFFQGNVNETEVLGNEEQCTEFGFSSIGYKLAHDLTQDMDWSNVRWCRVSGSRQCDGLRN